MTEHNPYQTPEANLNTTGVNGKVLNFKRFTAWGVFGLSIITLGIYPIYWMYTRALTVNQNHDNKISMGLLQGLVGIAVLSFASGFLGTSSEAQMVSQLISVAYFVIYLTVLFSLRNRIQEVINSDGSAFQSHLSGIMTFFFNTIYLQYKINEAIDSNSAGAR